MTSKSSPHPGPSSANKPLEEHLQGLELHLQNLQSQLDHIQSAKAYQVWQNIVPLKHSLVKVITDPAKIPKALKLLFKQGPAAVLKKAISVSHADEEMQSVNEQYQVWFQNNYPTAQDLDTQRQKATTFKHKPLISIITPTYNTPIKYLRECIESVINQSYPNWELCLADDCSPDPEVRKVIKEYASMDKRIKYVFRKTNGHISRASNSALKLAKGEWVGLLDHDDVLWPNALYEVAKLINDKPDVDFIYTDEDKLSEDGITHCDPFFKPGWSPDYLRSINYITHFTLIKSKIIEVTSGFKDGTEGAQDWDLFLRTTHYIEKNNRKKMNIFEPNNGIYHISKVLYSWRRSSSSTASEQHASSTKPYAFRNQEVVLKTNLSRLKTPGEISETSFLGAWFTKYVVKDAPLVSIIIPTKENLPYLERCIDSIYEKTTYSNFEIILVDTGSTSSEVLNYYSKLRASHQNIAVVSWLNKFNFSAVSNLGASNAKGEFYLFLNNDTEVLSEDWIQVMLGYAQLSHAGAVGAKLYYPNMTIQHLGGLLGVKGDPKEIGIAGHAYVGHLKAFRNFDSVCVKNYSFVTAACLMINKKKFKEVNGFDEKFVIAFNDVDLGLKLIKKGYYNIVVPQVELIHHESVSTKKPHEDGRDVKQWRREIELFIDRWGEIKDTDPFFNINFSRNRTDFSIIDNKIAS